MKAIDLVMAILSTPLAIIFLVGAFTRSPERSNDASDRIGCFCVSILLAALAIYSIAKLFGAT